MKRLSLSPRLALFLLLIGIPCISLFSVYSSSHAATTTKPPLLRLPWPLTYKGNQVQHGINGGDTYGCGLHQNADFYAIDFVFSLGDPVSAVAPGIAQTGYLVDPNGNGYGNYVLIHHTNPDGTFNGFTSLYAHLSSFNIPQGQPVSVTQGQIIAFSGNTGNVPPHLHFVVYQTIASTDNTPWNDGKAVAYMPEPMSGYTGFGQYGYSSFVDPTCNTNNLSPNYIATKPSAAWQTVTSASPGTYNQFYGSSAVNAYDMWAVGQFNNQAALAEHWNGSTWTANSPAPVLVGTESAFYAVTSPATNDVWAVGYACFNSGGCGTPNPLIEHFDGSSWSVITNPALLGIELTGVAELSTTSLWVVGLGSNGVGVMEQGVFDGTNWNWTQYSGKPPVDQNNNPIPGTGDLNALTVISPTNIWAVGEFFPSTNLARQTLIEHWDGTAWNYVTSPNPGTNFNVLFSITAVSSSQLWAVGFYGNVNTNYHPSLILKGTLKNSVWAWSQVASPNPGNMDNKLYAIAAISSKNIYAVGFSWSYPTGLQNDAVIDHWNGSAWSQDTSPNYANGLLVSITVIPANMTSTDDLAWAVGERGAAPEQTLTEFRD